MNDLQSLPAKQIVTTRSPSDSQSDPHAGITGITVQEDTEVSTYETNDRVRQRLIQDLGEAAEWRRRKAIEHPDDVRNTQCASTVDAPPETGGEA